MASSNKNPTSRWSAATWRPLWPRSGAIAKTNARQQLTRTRASLLSAQTSERESQRDILTRSHRRNEIEILKDHADGETSITRHLFFAEWTKRFRSEEDFTFGRMVEPA